jgi:hypothetical protein
MATPADSNYPDRGRIRSQLGPVLGPVQSLGANRGYEKYEELSEIYQNESDVYYRPKTTSQSMEDPDSEYSVAFAETNIPTSSTNYSRPRTVAAGYDPERQTMTVVFRDGTFYNYYEVTPGEWRAFKASISKGNPWLNRANKNQGSDGLFVGKPRGQADVSNISPQVRELLYRVVRTQQVRRGPQLNRGKMSTSSARRSQGALRARAPKQSPRGRRKP